MERIWWLVTFEKTSSLHLCSSEIFITVSESWPRRHFVTIRIGRMKTMKMGMKRTMRMAERMKAIVARTTAMGRRRKPTSAPHREQP